MPEISFYLLSTNSSQERDLFVCKLIEKACRNNDFPYVLTASPEQSQQLDDMLWTFRPGSFVPHQQYHGELPELENVVLIGAEQPPAQWRRTIINLSRQGPANFMAANRILEIIDDNEEIKASGRKRYRQYRLAGIEIATYNIETSA